MATGSSSKTLDNKQKVTSSNPPNNNNINIEPFVPKRDHNPRDLKSWAKRTGFVSFFSGETSASSTRNFRNETSSNNESNFGRNNTNSNNNPIFEETESTVSSPKIEFQPPGNGFQRNENRDEERREFHGHGNGNAHVLNEERRVNEMEGENEVGFYDKFPNLEDPIPGRQPLAFKVKCGILDNPGFVPVIYYGIQHYFALIGSLVLIPLMMVPAMGGTDKDTANVMSTVLLVSGITTLLQSFFGTRLPLVQGSSSVYFAPALVIMNSKEFRNLTQHVHNERTARGYNNWIDFSEHIGIQWPHVFLIKAD